MALVAIAVLSSCTNEDSILDKNLHTKGNKVFTATLENSVDTRATLNSSKTAQWESTDRVNINGVVYKVTPKSDDATTAVLTKKNSDDEDPSGTFRALYPTTFSYVSGTSIKYSLPAVHTYAEGKFNMPMYAEGTSTELSFKNLCGVVAVSVKNIDDIKAVRIISASPTDKLSGEFTITMSDGIPILNMGTVTSNQVSVICGDANVDADATTGKVFYLPLPAATYSQLQVVVESGTSTISQMITSGNVEIARNKIYSTTFHASSGDISPIYATTNSETGNPTSAVRCVTLWSGSPIFATMNVGQTTAFSSLSTDYTTGLVGGWYNWGVSEIQTSSNKTIYHYGTASLSGDTDTATKLWGGVWRMLTFEELKAITAGVILTASDNQNVVGINTTWTWLEGSDSSNQYVPGCTLKGIKILGKNGNSVFFPAAGSSVNGVVLDQGFLGSLWTADSYETSDRGCSLIFTSSLHDPLSLRLRDRGYSVRAVLK